MSLTSPERSSSNSSSRNNYNYSTSINRSSTSPDTRGHRNPPPGHASSSSSPSPPSPSVSSTTRPTTAAESQQMQQPQAPQLNFAYILPVLFYEYLAVSITKSLIPGMILDAFGTQSYVMIGVMETTKGIFAFLACPLFGKISDHIGRKYCLLVTVVGTTVPVVAMGFTENMYVFATMTALSGLFSATFPLTFAYITDCVTPHERAPAFGLALATFGLSFCLGPVSGGLLASLYGNRVVFLLSGLLMILDVCYIVFVLPESARAAIFAADEEKDRLRREQQGEQRRQALLAEERELELRKLQDLVFTDGEEGEWREGSGASSAGTGSSAGAGAGAGIGLGFGAGLGLGLGAGPDMTLAGVYNTLKSSAQPIANSFNSSRARSWTRKVADSLSAFSFSDILAPFKFYQRDEFMQNLAVIVFLYYTAVWAVVSTLMVHVTKRLGLDSVQVGYLLTLYGLATMFSESVLVRFLVPTLGETRCMRLGLGAFAVQCMIITWADSLPTLYGSILFSMLSNLVYPSVSSLIAKVVDDSGDMQHIQQQQQQPGGCNSSRNSGNDGSGSLIGEALGTLNGIKALTEGFGPLVFGLLMSTYESFPSPMQSAPYLIAAFLALWAMLHCYELPTTEGRIDSMPLFAKGKKGRGSSAGRRGGISADSGGVAADAGSGVSGMLTAVRDMFMRPKTANAGAAIAVADADSDAGVEAGSPSRQGRSLSFSAASSSSSVSLRPQGHGSVRSGTSSGVGLGPASSSYRVDEDMFGLNVSKVNRTAATTAAAAAAASSKASSRRTASALDIMRAGGGGRGAERGALLQGSSDSDSD